MSKQLDLSGNVLTLPFSETLTPTSFDLPNSLTADQWLEAGRALGRVHSLTMWWLGHWWAYGEHRYGDRRALVEADDWEGPRFQTCANAALVCRAFETSRRREVVSFTAHSEVAVLPPEWQDKVLDAAAKEGHSTREIRAEWERMNARKMTDRLRATVAFARGDITP